MFVTALVAVVCSIQTLEHVLLWWDASPDLCLVCTCSKFGGSTGLWVGPTLLVPDDEMTGRGRRGTQRTEGT